MELQNAGAEAIASQYRMKKTVIVTVGALLFVVITIIAGILCNLQFKYSTQETLSTQRDMQQAWVDKSLEAIRSWRGVLVEQARSISTSEMFRLFAVDVKSLGPDGPARVSAPDASRSGDEVVSSLAEQLAYMRDILLDSVRRRQWISARVLTEEGDALITPDFAEPLLPAQTSLVKRAASAKTTVFGPVRRQDDVVMMDVVDPLYAVLGKGDPEPVAFLLITLPMEKNLAGFLAQSLDQNREFLPSILNRGPQGMEAVLWRDGAIRIVRAVFEPDADLSLPFRRRQLVGGGGEAYSLGSRLTELDWCVMLEVPAAMVDGLLESQKHQIYGLGVLGSVGTALLLAFVWASIVSRSHRATSRHFQHLYTVIRQQKLMLDSINASLQVGLLLVNSEGHVLVCNPAFCQIAGKTEEELTGVSLDSALPSQVAETLRAGMERVAGVGEMASIEISLDSGDGLRLYRVTLFPFEDQQDTDENRAGGCVGIFQDITEFRRRAEDARRRQASLIAALVRAIESVDVNLIGHSQKMERVVELLSAQMGLEEKDRETLRLAARLCQVGKIFVPRNLLTKTGKLTPEEQQEVMRAPEYAYNALRDLQFGLPVPEAVYQMGERMDGTGNPQRLEGEQIVTNARILAVVNAFCAMTSARSYRAGMSPAQAIELLARNPGFDVRVVENLAALSAAELRSAVNVGEDTGGGSGSIEV
ncbi:MAG: PAS domain-containing protein [Desulfovibrio sp.]|jgi:PAS domain S-box-containing protein|nr:PAS domain-containing protein [Desulfovibrio sp.]